MIKAIYTIFILLGFFLSIYFFRGVEDLGLKVTTLILQFLIFTGPIVKMLIARQKGKEDITLELILFRFFIILIPLSISILLAIFNLVLALKIVTCIILVIACLYDDEYSVLHMIF